VGPTQRKVDGGRRRGSRTHGGRAVPEDGGGAGKVRRSGEFVEGWWDPAPRRGEPHPTRPFLALVI